LPRKTKYDRFVKPVTSKGRVYLYFDTGRIDERGRKVMTRLPDLSDRFHYGSTYAGLLAARTRREREGVVDATLMTIPKLIDLFQRSPQWRELSDRSQYLYTMYLDRFAKMMPTAPAAEVTGDDIVRIMDKMGKTPGAANLLLGAVASLYKWARGRHVPRECRPTFEVERFKLGEHDPWPEHVVEAALTCDDADIRLATHLLYFTAQRIGDVLKMRWSDVRDGYIHQLVQQKTDVELTIPVHERLEAELARTPRNGLTIIANAKGRKRSQEWVRTKLQAFAREHGVDIVPHGLRKNAVNALLENECSVAETAAISGQTLQLVEFYAKKRDQKKLARGCLLGVIGKAVSSASFGMRRKDRASS
jgi:integrase